MSDDRRPGRKQRGGFRAAFAAALAGLMCMSCASINPYYDPAKPHHTEHGFKNNYMQGAVGDGVLKWQWERTLAGLPKPPENHYQFPVVQPDLEWLKANRTETTATWIGHATMLMQVNGMNVLTDPIFSERASPFSFAGPKRMVPLPVHIADLPQIDVVVISHNHYDHLDLDSVVALSKQAGGSPLFLVPLGLKAWFLEQGIREVVELDWWNKTELKGLKITLVPVQHWSARSLGDRFDTLWGGWVVQTPPDAPKPFSFFFAGDTGYSKDFADIGKRFGGFDLALLPVGAYAPRWFMGKQHIDPAQAVMIHRDVKAKQSIGIHWGTFELTDEPLDEPPKVLAAETAKAGLAPATFTVLKHGETRKF